MSKKRKPGSRKKRAPAAKPQAPAKTGTVAIPKAVKKPVAFKPAKRDGDWLKRFNSWFDRSAGFSGLIDRYGNIALLAIAALVLMGIALADTPQRRGDGNEYYQMMISWADHGDPGLTVSDGQEYDRLRAEIAEESSTFNEDIIANVNLNNGYTGTGEEGEYYSVHFWLFSLTAVPVMSVLKLFGQNELMALQVANALFVIFAMAMVLLYSGLDRWKRWLFFALALFSPALWYMDWPGPEIFSYSFVVAGIAVFTRRKYALAVLFAALASTQNPPIAFLAAYFLIYGVVDLLRRRPLKAGPLTLGVLPLALAALPVLLPMAFYYIKYGTPNLIYKVNEASFEVISPTRTLSFFFDLNQGILPYIPVVCVFFAFLLAVSWHRRERRIYEITLVILLMALLAETTTNWNSDAEGIMRYAVWILPLFFWGVIETSNLSFWTDRIFLGVAIVSQVFILFSYPAWFIAKHEGITDPALYVKNNALAAWVLDNHPSLYNPEPEIFLERTMKREYTLPFDDHLPVLYYRADGTVTKILTGAAGMDVLDEYGDIDPAVLAELKESHQGDTGTFYVDLSPGQMSFKVQDARLSSFKDKIAMVDPPATLPPNTGIPVSVSIANTSLENWYSQGKYSLNVSYHVYDKDGNPVRLENPRINIPHRLGRGEQLTMPVTIYTPAEPGTYIFEFDLVQEGITWFKDQGNKTATMQVEVR